MEVGENGQILGGDILIKPSYRLKVGKIQMERVVAEFREDQKKNLALSACTINLEIGEICPGGGGGGGGRRGYWTY